MTKHLLLGLGQIGQSLLRLLKDSNLFTSDSFYCIDSNPETLIAFLDAGGTKDHYLCSKLNENNYTELLSSYSKGDFIIDLTNNVSNIDILKYSLHRGIHYLSASDSYWHPGDPAWKSAHQHFKQYWRLARRTKSATPTSIIEFGMNPGLVSCFAKKCLELIVETDTTSFFLKNRNRLMRLIKKQKYGKVAKIIGVLAIIEVDNDNQVFEKSLLPSCVYSTWCPEAFFHEELSAPEMIVGTWREFWQFKNVRDCDFSDYYISLAQSGINSSASAFSPQGQMTGSVITHEEVFSISYAFKSFRYKPSVFFVYKPCEQALESLKRNEDNKQPSFDILSRNCLISGGESVGVIIQGKRFKTAYFGNYLDSTTIDETATVLQTSASVFAAFRYIQNHPNEGLLFPDDTNADEMLNEVQKRLKSFIFQPCSDVHISFEKQE